MRPRCDGPLPATRSEASPDDSLGPRAGAKGGILLFAAAGASVRGARILGEKLLDQLA